MALSEYTTYADVRAALGVEDDELKDATLELEVYEFNLREELIGIDPDLPADYATVAALTTRTAVERRFYELSRLFACYAVAKQLLASLPMFGPKEVTDGKAGVTRFALDPYKETTKKVTEQYDSFKTKLQAAYAAFNSTTATTVERPYLVLSTPSSDPVTG